MRTKHFLIESPRGPNAFHHEHDPPMNPLPHEGSHTQKRDVIERGRESGRPSYVKSFTEVGRRLRKRGLLP